MDRTEKAPRRWGRPAALVTGGLLAGGVLAGTLSAYADSSSGTSGTAEGQVWGYGSGTGGGAADLLQSQRPDERLLSGATAEKVRAAALAKYPGATILRLETDSDGVYEAHLVTKEGQPVTVEVNEDFAVTGTESGPGGHGRDGSPRSPSSGAATSPAITRAAEEAGATT